MAGLEALLGGGGAPPPEGGGVPPDLQYPGIPPGMAQMVGGGAPGGEPPMGPPPMEEPPMEEPPMEEDPMGGAGSELEAYKALIDQMQQVMEMPSVTEQERAVIQTCQTNIQKLLAQNEKMEEQAGANPALRKALAY